MKNVIETNKLTKRFGSLTAVNQVSINVQKGEIYGFLGLNGAGKTTTIRMLLGMIRPTSGDLFLNGKRVHSGGQPLWNDIGYLVETPYAYPDLTVKENLEIFRKLRFISDAGAVDAVMEKLQLTPYRERLAKNLSLGNAQRLGLAKALIHNPNILILDEPANGLDPAGIVEIRELLLELAGNKGVTILIASHILSEISKFATHIGIIDEGMLIQECNTNELEHFLRKRLYINTGDNDGAKAALIKKGYSTAMIHEGKLEVSDEEAVKSPGKVNLFLINAGFLPTMLKIEEEDLETYFLRVIGKNGGPK
jgi:ABC-2 type transport system ATP-binding protein